MGTRTVTLTGTVRDAAGHAVSTATQITVNTMTIGMNAPLGAEWDAAVANYPGIKYTRDFGKDNAYSPADSDTWTELSPYGTGKAISAPAGCIVHYSCKDDMREVLPKWFNTLPSTLPAGHPGFIVSPWHEPHDDVRNGTITTAWFQDQGTYAADYIKNHTKGWMIKGNGPILTRYDLDEAPTPANPASYGYPGMTHFFVDSYMSPTNVGTYWSTTKMFDTPFNKIRAAFPGIRIGVPEYGLSKQTADTSGQARATAITNHVNYCRNLGYVDWFAYFNDEGSIPAVPFTPTSPEGIAYKALLANQ